MTVRAILFDLGDTLFGLDPLPGDLGLRVAKLLAAEGMGEGGALAGACNEAVAGIGAAMAASRAAGRLEEHDLAALADEQFRALGLRLSAVQAAAVGDVFAVADVERFAAPPRVHERVEAFAAAGYRLAAVSNTTTRPALLEEYLESAGLLRLFDTVVFSARLGLRKPHPAMYEAALAGIAVSAEEAVFVGDRVREDVLGPRAVGLKAVLTHEFRQEDPAGSEPLAIIGSLPELHGVLGRL